MAAPIDVTFNIFDAHKPVQSVACIVVLTAGILLCAYSERLKSPDITSCDPKMFVLCIHVSRTLKWNFVAVTM
jgi:hypothetical protein